VESRIELVHGSLSSQSDVESAVRGCDFVLHQAAIPSVPRSVEFPLESHETNATGTLRLLRSAADAGVRRLVYASSSSVYGASPLLPKVESMPTEPLSPYAVSKLSAEQYAVVFHRLYGLETACLRYFNVFGPRQDPDSPYSGVVSRFIDAIASETPPTIHGDGEQTRDFTYVENVARANLAATERPEAAGSVYNVGCATRISLNQLWRIMAELSGSELEPRYTEPRAGDVPHSLADIGRARTELGYEPAIDVREGLRRTLSYYGILRQPSTTGHRS